MHELLNRAALYVPDAKIVRMKKLVSKAKQSYAAKQTSKSSGVYLFVGAEQTSQLKEKFQQAFRQEQQKYPMLELLSKAGYYDFNPQHVAEYIKKFS